MAVPAYAPPQARFDARIETCLAEFEVTAPTGPLSSPEKLLAAVRQEVLPALSNLLETSEWRDVDLTVDHIEIDLGEWPDDPVWSDLRYVLALKLRDALMRFLPTQDSATEAPFRATAPSAQDAINPYSLPDASQPDPREQPGTDQRPASDLGPSIDNQGVDAKRPTNGDQTPQERVQAHGTKSRSTAELATELKSFASWFERQSARVGTADVDRRLAAQPAERAALLLWKAAAPDAQKATLSLTRRKGRILRKAVAQLAAKNGTMTNTNGLAKKISGPVPRLTETAFRAAREQDTRAQSRDQRTEQAVRGSENQTNGTGRSAASAPHPDRNVKLSDPTLEDRDQPRCVDGVVPDSTRDAAVARAGRAFTADPPAPASKEARTAPSDRLLTDSQLQARGAEPDSGTLRSAASRARATIHAAQQAHSTDPAALEAAISRLRASFRSLNLSELQVEQKSDILVARLLEHPAAPLSFPAYAADHYDNDVTTSRGVAPRTNPDQNLARPAPPDATTQTAAPASHTPEGTRAKPDAETPHQTVETTSISGRPPQTDPNARAIPTKNDTGHAKAAKNTHVSSADVPQPDKKSSRSGRTIAQSTPETPETPEVDATNAKAADFSRDAQDNVGTSQPCPEPEPGKALAVGPGTSTLEPDIAPATPARDDRTDPGTAQSTAMDTSQDGLRFGAGTPSETVGSEPDNRASSDPQNTRSDDRKDPLEPLAMALDAPQGIPASALAKQRFVSDPATTFDVAHHAGALPALAAMLPDEKVARAALAGLSALTADQVRTLMRASPTQVMRGVDQLTERDALELCSRLLPPKADLMRRQIAQLEHRAKTPRAALQRAAIALLQNVPVDLEALAGFEPTKGGIAETTDQPQVTDTLQKAAGTSHGTPSDPLTSGKTPDTAATDPHPSRSDTPLETLLVLSGLSEQDVKRVLVRSPATSLSDPPTVSRPDTSQGRPDPTTSAIATTPADRNPSVDRNTSETTNHCEDTKPAAPQMSDTDLRRHLSELLGSEPMLAEGGFDDVLQMIWSLWPRHTEGAAEDLEAQFQIICIRLAAMVDEDDAPKSLVERLSYAIEAIELNTEKRTYAMRTVAARLANVTGPDYTGLRQMTRQAVETLLSTKLDPDAAPTQETARTPVQVDAKRGATDTDQAALTRAGSPRINTYRSDFAEPDASTETIVVTETAGLVLLHPFYNLLFDRLKIARDGRELHLDAVPRALGALQFLAGGDLRPDPLQRVLLGLDQVLPLPEIEAPDPDACILMDGLLRSMIDRWGRLGQTSPDGLRDTFLRRTGTLRFDDTGARLRVTPGPFDMLLDGLPWSAGPVTLPWMPLPCYVSWREGDDA